tara:strand:- start:2436 stop:2597 length:162 start_codon:yes stop_codon:yes gene_type:complete
MPCHGYEFHPQFSIVLNIDFRPRQFVSIEIPLGLETVRTDIGTDNEKISIGAI